MERKRRSKVEFYAHLVWTTRHRAPLVTRECERRLHRCVQSEAERLDCVVLAINGMPDHIHLVVQMPSKLSIARLAQSVKGNSSRFANATLGFGGAFDWQQHYGAFSLSRSHLTRIIGYVERQKSHHAAGNLWPEWEESEECADEDESAEN